MESTLQKLKYIEKNTCIYNIHYCKAGVGFNFFEEHRAKDEAFFCGEDWWKKGLVTYAYYPSFSKAVDAEYKRIKNIKKEKQK